MQPYSHHSPYYKQAKAERSVDYKTRLQRGALLGGLSGLTLGALGGGVLGGTAPGADASSTLIGALLGGGAGGLLGAATRMRM